MVDQFLADVLYARLRETGHVTGLNFNMGLQCTVQIIVDICRIFYLWRILNNNTIHVK